MYSKISRRAPAFSAQLLSVCPQAHWLEYQVWAAPILQRPLEVKDGFAIPQKKPVAESRETKTLSSTTGFARQLHQLGRGGCTVTARCTRDILWPEHKRTVMTLPLPVESLGPPPRDDFSWTTNPEDRHKLWRARQT